MCEIYQIQINATTNQYDPTRTTVLRNVFAADTNRRFEELIRVIVKSIVDLEVLGEEIKTQQMKPPLPRAFDFPLDSDKVEAFMRWVQDQIDAGILEVGEIPGTINISKYAWTNKYILDSYKRGLIRARIEMKKAGYDVPNINDSGGVNALLNTPFHIERVGLLYIRAYNQLQSITEAMAKQITEVLTQGMIDGDGMRVIARKLKATINGTNMGDLGITDTLGRYIPAKRRAEMMARTEVIRAHHQATINEYMSWGVHGVNVKAEFRTAGDNRVCSECSALEGSVWTLEEAFSLIPVHPMCRCICLPYKQLQ